MRNKRNRRMRFEYIAFFLLLVIWPAIANEALDIEPAQSTLHPPSLGNDGARSPVMLLLHNRSNSIVGIWPQSCSWGFESVSAELVAEDGRSVVIRRAPRGWNSNIPLTIPLLKGRWLVLPLDFGDDSWTAKVIGLILYPDQQIDRRITRDLARGTIIFRYAQGEPETVGHEIDPLWIGQVETDRIPVAFISILVPNESGEL